MKNKKSRAPIALFKITICLLGLFLLGCASNYRLIEPLKIDYQTVLPKKVDGTDIKIYYRYNILKDKGNSEYSKRERLYGISLLAVLIDNPGQDTLTFPDDLIIIAKNIVRSPLELNETFSIFLQEPIPSVPIEIETKKSGTFYLDFELLDALIAAKANKRFVEEMREYYLVNSIILPGSQVAGILVLPVKRYTPLTFRMNRME